MANNYQQWSTAFPWPEQRKAEAVAWLRAATRDLDLENGEHEGLEEVPWRDYDNLDGNVDFRVEISDECFILYAEESGNLDHAVLLMQEFFKNFMPEAIGVIEWSHTCSSMRPGEFGGGVVVFDKDTSRWQGTAQAAEDLLAQLSRDAFNTYKQDPETNKERADRAAKALRDYAGGCEPVMEQGVLRQYCQDLLTDLRHWCRGHELDADAIFEDSGTAYREEQK